MFHRTLTGNFRQIIDVKKIDVCTILDKVGQVPMFTDFVKHYNKVYPGLVHRCPYEGVS